MTKTAALILALVFSACGSRNVVDKTAADMPFSQTRVDTWQVEVLRPPEGSRFEPSLSVVGYGKKLEELSMEEVEGQPNVFRGSVLSGSSIIITIEMFSEGAGFCGDSEISYCGPIRLWLDEGSAGDFIETIVRLNSLKSNPIQNDTVVCNDGTKESMGNWQDHRCVYSNYVLDSE